MWYGYSGLISWNSSKIIFLQAREGYYQLFNDNSEVSVHEYTKDQQCTPKGQLRLDKLATQGTAEKTHRFVPNAKLLAIVKEPVNRAMSHYVHRMENGMEDEHSNFDSVIASIMDKGIPSTVQASVLFRQSSFLARLKPWIAEYEPVHEKTNNLGFRIGLIQTELYKHRRWLNAWNFGFKKKRDCTICVAKTKALISFAVTAKLICAFVFAYANCWFSHAQAHMA